MTPLRGVDGMIVHQRLEIPKDRPWLREHTAALVRMYRHGIDPERIAEAMDRPYSIVAYVVLRLAEAGRLSRREFGCARRVEGADRAGSDAAG